MKTPSERREVALCRRRAKQGHSLALASHWSAEPFRRERNGRKPRRDESQGWDEQPECMYEIRNDSEHRREARAREWPCLARRGMQREIRAQ